MQVSIFISGKFLYILHERQVPQAVRLSDSRKKAAFAAHLSIFFCNPAKTGGFFARTKSRYTSRPTFFPGTYQTDKTAAKTGRSFCPNARLPPFLKVPYIVELFLFSLPQSPLAMADLSKNALPFSNLSGTSDGKFRLFTFKTILGTMKIEGEAGETPNYAAIFPRLS